MSTMAPNDWTVVPDPRGGYRLTYDGDYSGSQMTEEEAEQHAVIVNAVDHATNIVFSFVDEYVDDLPEHAAGLARGADEQMWAVWEAIVAPYQENAGEVVPIHRLRLVDDD